MSDTLTSFGWDENAATRGNLCTTYEPPKVTLVGNARDLLAGAAGTVPDGEPLASESGPGG